MTMLGDDKGGDTPRRVARAIQRHILRGELLPGEQIRQREWAERLGVSGVPLREALKILAAEDVIIHDPHRGFFVAKLAVDEVVQLYRLRIFVEKEILSEIEWPSDYEIGIIKEIMETMIQHLITGNAEGANDSYRTLNVHIWSYSKLGLFVREARRLWNLTNPYRLANFASMRAADREGVHMRERRDQLIEALETRNTELLIDHMVGDLSSSIENLLQSSGPSIPLSGMLPNR